MSKTNGKNLKLKQHRRLFGARNDRIYIIQNLALLASSGMDVLTALDSMSSEAFSKRMKRLILSIKQNIEDGLTLWKSLEYTGLFPERTISILRIGEESNRLLENLNIVATQIQKENDLRSKVTSAMLYPIIVFLLTFLIGLGIAFFILPNLASTYDKLNIELPLITQLLVRFGKFMKEYGYIALPGSIIFVVFLFLILFSFKKTRFLGQSLIFSISPIRKLIIEVEVSRFAFTMGTLLQAGIPVMDTLAALPESTIFVKYQKLYRHLIAQVEDGASFKQCFSSYPNSSKLIPLSVQQLIFSAEKSGQLSKVLLKVNSIYEAKNDVTTKNISIILEPILLVIVWVGVGMLAIAVILPIYGVVGGITNAAESQSSSSTSTSQNNPTSTPSPTPSPTITVTPTVTQTPTPTSSPVPQRLQITGPSTSTVNVRATPSTSAKVVKKVRAGEIFEYSVKQGNWYLIKLDATTTGWVDGKLVIILS